MGIKKSKKRVIPQIRYIIKKFEDFEQITGQEAIQQAVYSHFINAVKYSLDNNKSEAEIVKLYDTNMVLTLKKEEWIEPLNKAIQFYSVDENNYEKCAELQKIIEKIK